MKWPKAGMTAFRMAERGTVRTNAWVDGRPPLHVMAWAFREAAATILKNIESGGLNDVLVYPYLFNWRHFIELEMKSLIPLARDYHELPEKPLKLHHFIADYWKELRPLIEKASGSAEDSDALAGADAIIAEFVTYDPDSFTFRYPTSKGGDRPLERVPRVLNLRQFHDSMEGIANFFDGVYCQMFESVSNRNENYYANMPDWRDT
ncbi:MAG: hypothetical protein V4850_30665 [Myxococcota bacterium]